MALNLKDQIKNLIEKASSILIPLPKDSSADSIASSVALKKYLEKENKKVDICGDIDNERYQFLIQNEPMKRNVDLITPFLISINIKETKLKEFKYDIEDSNLKIYLYPEEGGFKKEDVVLREGDPEYDLVITISTPELESLGELYYKYPTFFLSTPIINIDYSPANENYGTVNFIDTSRSSSSEIVYDFLKKEDFEIDKNLATILLAGIIEETNCFRKPKLPPLTFNTIGELVDLGADREYLIKVLYQNKPLSAIKLWGKVLSKLKFLPKQDKMVVWSILTNDDFIKSQASINDLKLIFRDFINYIPEIKCAFIIAEYEPKKIYVQIANLDFNLDIYKIFNVYPLKKSRNFYYFEIKNEDILDVERDIIDRFENYLKKDYAL